MAMVISDLDHRFDPEPGESIVFLTLVKLNHGYAVKAITNENRDIGRWVSECPLAVSTTAMLWLTQRPWDVRLSKDSLDMQKVLDEVPSIAQRNRIHPQDAIEALRRNFPEKPTESAITGARVELRPRTTPRPALTGPVAPAPRRATTPPQLEEQLSDEEIAQRRFVAGLDKALRRANTAMAAGRDPAASLKRLIGELGLDPAFLPAEVDHLTPEQVEGIKGGLVHQIRALRSNVDPIAVRDGTFKMLGIDLEDLDVLSEEDEAEDEDLMTEDPEEGEAIPEPVQPTRLRALGKDEIPPGLTPEQEAELAALSDPGATEKMARTHARWQREHDRVNKAVAAKARAEARAPAPPENGHGNNGHTSSAAPVPEKVKGRRKAPLLPAQAPVASVKSDTEGPQEPAGESAPEA